MIEFELFILICINMLILHILNKRQNIPSYSLEEPTKELVKRAKKAFVKRDKYKPQVNDDYRAWQDENKS